MKKRKKSKIKRIEHIAALLAPVIRVVLTVYCRSDKENRLIRKKTIKKEQKRGGGNKK